MRSKPALVNCLLVANLRVRNVRNTWRVGDAETVRNMWRVGDAEIVGNTWRVGDAEIVRKTWRVGDADVVGNTRRVGDAETVRNMCGSVFVTPRLFGACGVLVTPRLFGAFGVLVTPRLFGACGVLVTRRLFGACGVLVTPRQLFRTSPSAPAPERCISEPSFPCFVIARRDASRGLHSLALLSLCEMRLGAFIPLRCYRSARRVPRP
jgi:hypothetical protein